MASNGGDEEVGVPIIAQVDRRPHFKGSKNARTEPSVGQKPLCYKACEDGISQARVARSALVDRQVVGQGTGLTTSTRSSKTKTRMAALSMESRCTRALTSGSSNTIGAASATPGRLITAPHRLPSRTDGCGTCPAGRVRGTGHPRRSLDCHFQAPWSP